MGSAHLLLILPWLVFLGLGLSMARLLQQAWQEQALLEALAAKARRERILIGQKQNFIRLSSHYLRTPLTLILNGIEVLGVGSKAGKHDGLQPDAQKLKEGIEALLAQEESGQTTAKHLPLPNFGLYISASLMGALVVISAAVYLLAHLDTTNFKASSLFGEIAVVILAAALLYGARRSRSSHRLVQKHYEELLNEQRLLDQQRNSLAMGSLNALSGPLSRLKQNLAQADRRQPGIKAASEGVIGLEMILQDFTILASLESGAMSTKKEEVNLKQIVRRIAARFDSQLKQKSLQIRTDLQVEKLTQDPLLLEYVLNSLLDNAIEYSPANSHIDVISRAPGNFIDIFVKDQGSSIPKDKLEVLFQPFSRAEDAEHFEHPGIGMSLYLDKLIMRYFGGDIKAQSRPGNGTVMKLRLPNSVDK